MKDQIIAILSQQLNPDLVKDLVNSYVGIMPSYVTNTQGARKPMFSNIGGAHIPLACA